MRKLAKDVKRRWGKSLQKLVHNIYDELVSQQITPFYTNEAQIVVAKMMKEDQYEDLIPGYLKYCKQFESKPDPNSITSRVVTGKDECHPWKKDRITLALKREGGIPPDLAKQVADAIETKISHANTRYITTSQIRELINSELFSMGHSYYRQRQSSLGIPKFNLKKLLYPKYQQGATKNINELIWQISSIILKQYSLEEVFAAEIVKAHLKGQIHIEGISLPMKFFTLMLDSIYHTFGKRAETQGRIISLVALIEKMRPYVYDSLNIKHLDDYLDSAKSEDIESLLIGLTHNFDYLFSCCFYLKNSPGEFTDELVDAYRGIDKANKRAFLPQVVVPLPQEYWERNKQRDSLRKLCELSLEMRRVFFAFQPPYLGNWPSKNSLALDTIVLNLVQASYEAGPKNLGKFWDKLNETFSIVLKAHLDKRRFMLSLSEGPLQDLFQSPFETSYPIDEAVCFLEIVGLAESIFLLTGQEMHQEEGWEISIQTLARLQELTQNVEEKHGIRIKLVDYMQDGEAERRFVKNDLERYPELKNIFPEAVYTKGPHFRLANLSMNAKEQIQREAELHSFFPGTIHLMPEMDANELMKILEFAGRETEVSGIKIC